jgi:hypothetical protein
MNPAHNKEALVFQLCRTGRVARSHFFNAVKKLHNQRGYSLIIFAHDAEKSKLSRTNEVQNENRYMEKR